MIVLSKKKGVKSSILVNQVSDTHALLEFVKGKEFLCCGFTEKLLKTKSNHEGLRFFEVTKNNRIIGGFLTTRFGQILHYLPFVDCVYDFSESEYSAVRRLIAELLKNYRAYCIVGTGAATEFLSDCLMSEVRENRDYDLMVCTTMVRKKNAVDVSLQGMGIRLCLPSSIEEVYSLQKGYDLEEVLPKGSSYSEKAAKKLLNKKLKTKTVFGLFSKSGRCIAKISTNAQARNWCQIGGVYTCPEWRGRGCASMLTFFLADFLRKKGFFTCLFVKSENEAAKKAYRRAGFEYYGSFKIIYLNNA